MCGIIGMISPEQPITTAILDRAVASLRHRGPDAQRCWVAPHGRVGLGHARLSIMDPVHGAQPMSNEDGSLHIVVNGEFYEFERHRLDLCRRGHRFATRSDSEILLHLYEEHGLECLEHLRGEFAFILWDEPRQRLFAARDRFGIKPLFYRQTEGRLMLASEVKALACAGPLRWDHASLFQNLFASITQDRTLFEGVHQLPAGHYLCVGKGAVRVVRYWDVNYPPRNRSVQKAESEWIEQLRAGVKESVRLRLRADVPVACLLSGGLDSSAALGIAQELSSAPLSAFTVGFDHAEYDESAVAERVARRAGAVFHPVRLTNADFAAHFADAVWHAEALHYNAHGTARYLLSRAVREAGFKVVLAGEGGDELGAGYHFCERALQSQSTGGWSRRLALPWRLLRRHDQTEALIAGTSPWLVRVSRLLGFPEGPLRYVAEKIGLMRGLLSAEFAAEFARTDPYREFFRQFDVRKQLWGREPVKQLLYLWLKSFFVNYVLAGERLDMAHGLELRLPFLDHKLFEFAREIPASLFVREGRQKFVLREAMRPFVPEEVYAGRKQPFIAPPVLAGTTPMFHLVQDTLRSRVMDAVPFFDRRAVLSFLDRFAGMSGAERSAADPVLLLLLSICVLQERYQLARC
jgi:asparagine synthase (glutamine-hydrolysing)